MGPPEFFGTYYGNFVHLWGPAGYEGWWAGIIQHMSSDQRQPILVTGAAGFIGSHLCRRLMSAGYRVVGVDNFDPYYAPKIKRENVQHLRDHADGLMRARSGPGELFELVEADICDRVGMQDVFERASPMGVIHLAAKAGVRPSIADPVGYARVNVLGTATILDAAHKAQSRGCDRVVVASSSSVYGNCPTTPFHEEMDVDSPISPYAATKRSSEILARAHHALTMQPVACLRFFTVYGPGQRPDLAIASFLGKVSRGEPIQIFGDGTTSRDYTYVEDIVTGIVAAYERIPRFGYRVWNLGNSSPITLNQMIETISQVVGKAAHVTRCPMQPGDVERTWADVTRAKAELEYQPSIEFHQGVQNQWDSVMRTLHAQVNP